jgi:hypothetical protein
MATRASTEKGKRKPSGVHTPTLALMRFTHFVANSSHLSDAALSDLSYLRLGPSSAPPLWMPRVSVLRAPCGATCSLYEVCVCVYACTYTHAHAHARTHTCIMLWVFAAFADMVLSTDFGSSTQASALTLALNSSRSLLFSHSLLPPHPSPLSCTPRAGTT